MASLSCGVEGTNMVVEVTAWVIRLVGAPALSGSPGSCVTTTARGGGRCGGGQVCEPVMLLPGYLRQLALCPGGWRHVSTAATGSLVGQAPPRPWDEAGFLGADTAGPFWQDVMWGPHPNSSTTTALAGSAGSTLAAREPPLLLGMPGPPVSEEPACGSFRCLGVLCRGAFVGF